MTQRDLDAALLRTFGLTKSFGSTRANHGVNITLHAGRVHALLGENGAGKSTLISMLAGFAQPDSGAILFDGVETVLDSPAAVLDAGIATVFQRSHLVAELSIRDNIRLQRRTSGNADQLADIEEIIGQLNLTPLLLDTAVATLDLGARQLVEIARAVARRPKLLILDEPTALISTESAQRLLAMLTSLAEQGMSILLVTHRLAEAMRVADEITVLRAGEVRATFEPGQPRDENALLAAMFGEAQISAESEPAGVDVTSLAPTADTAPVLELRGVSTQQSVAQRHLNSVSLSIAPGEIVGVAGISGNGQQHLAEVIEGTLRPVQGSVWLDRQEVTHRSVRDRIASGIRSVTDDRFGEGLVPSMSIGLNLLLKRIGAAPFWRSGLTNQREIDAYAVERIRDANIATRGADAPAGTLSGGNAQKLLLARESDTAARVTIYRQPTHGLDVKTVAEVYASIRAAARRGEGVLVISADLDEIVMLADRVLVLDRGAITASVAGHLPSTRDEIARAISGVHAR